MFRSFTFRSRQRTDYVGRRSPTPTRPSHHKHSVRVGARYTSLEERAHTKENECRGALNAFHVQICLSVSRAGSFEQSEDAGDLQRICPASQSAGQTDKKDRKSIDQSDRGEDDDDQLAFMLLRPRSLTRSMKVLLLR